MTCISMGQHHRNVCLVALISGTKHPRNAAELPFDGMQTTAKFIIAACLPENKVARLGGSQAELDLQKALFPLLFFRP